MNGTLDVATTTMRNANDAVIGLKQGKGTAGMLLRDEATAARIRQSIENVYQVTASLNQTARRADDLVSDIQSRQLGQKAEEVVSNARSATQNINTTTQQVRQTFDGYYSLSHLSPDEYRRNKLFSDFRNHRDWLQAGDLF